MSRPVDPFTTPHWYCLRSQPKHEHIAAAHLRQFEGVEVFCPRLRFKRSTRRGVIWATEALFPNYLFARFVMAESRAAVRYSRSVSGLVHFGDKYPIISEEIVEGLRAFMEGGELRTVESAVEVGDTVDIVEGPFQGQQGIVHRLLPGRERVRVLLEVLGGTREAEIQLKAIFKPGVPTALTEE
jgi:transcriptional antiterminator RfaH